MNENPDLEDDSDDDEENKEEGTSMAPRLVAAGHWQVTPSSTESRIAFEINPNIDINSKALLDMISETDTVSATTAKAPATSKPTNLEKKISVAEAFDNW